MKFVHLAVGLLFIKLPLPLYSVLAIFVPEAESRETVN